jgi:hypothetical protein
MNIQSTVYPETTLDQNEWMKAFKVSTLVPKYDGRERARKMMREWEENKVESFVALFKRIIDDWKIR